MAGGVVDIVVAVMDLENDNKVLGLRFEAADRPVRHWSECGSG